MPHDNLLRGAAAVAIVAPLLLTSVAHADTPALALDRFRPSAAGDALWGVEDPSVGPGRLAFSLLGSYAHDPLVITGGSDHDLVLRRVVREQLVLHAGIGVQIASRLALDLDMPFTAAQSGTGATIDGHKLETPSGGFYGDTRLGARVVLLAQNGALPSASLSFRVYLPSGQENQFSGAGGVRYAPSLVVGATFPGWLWSAQIGRTFQPENASLPAITGSDVFLSAGAAAKIDGLQIGPEIYASTVADSGSSSFSRTTTTVEAILGAKYLAGDFSAGLAAGPGISVGVGTPNFRVLFGVAYAPPTTKSRRSSTSLDGAPDGHGVTSGSGVATSGARGAIGGTADSDGDGVPDAEDLCPSVRDTRGGPRRGCPPDRDGDTIIDAEDACPDTPGPRSDDAAKNGCPVDTDGDGVTDAEDACPKEPGPRGADPKTSGCPTSARVEGQQIVIIEQVRFENAAATIKSESYPLLQAIVDVMTAHPEIARVAVDGHTDSRGVAARNIALSQSRALAVVRFLIDHGVDARRLETRAFGPRRPIASNDTEEGRAKNRRVEFQIRKRTSLGAAGWSDGPVE